MIEIIFSLSKISKVLEAWLEFEQDNHFKQKLHNLNSNNVFEKIDFPADFVKKCFSMFNSSELTPPCDCNHKNWCLADSLVLSTFLNPTSFYFMHFFRSENWSFYLQLSQCTHLISRPKLSFLSKLKVLINHHNMLINLKIRWCEMTLYLNK